jgi:glycosyltransferase involved in cell wall biosynthesis
MSVYNGERYLRKALESILSQTFADFEFVVIDDGSTDGTWAILTSHTDPRLRLVRNKENIGLTRSLNNGLALAQGEYTARMDADDISLPGRFERQLRFLQATGADLCFCRAQFTNEATGQETTWREANWSFTRWRGLFENRYGLHPGVMFRAEAIRSLGGYDESFGRAQDYELWDRCAAYGLRFAYVPEVLLCYRLRALGISRQHLAQQEECARKVSFRAMRRLLPGADQAELQGLRCLFLTREPPLGPEAIDAALQQSEELIETYLSLDARKEARFIWKDAFYSLYYRRALLSRCRSREGGRLLLRAALSSRSPSSLLRVLAMRLRSPV